MPVGTDGGVWESGARWTTGRGGWVRSVICTLPHRFSALLGFSLSQWKVGNCLQHRALIWKLFHQMYCKIKKKEKKKLHGWIDNPPEEKKGIGRLRRLHRVNHQMTSTLKTHIHRKNNKGAACSLAFMEFSLCPLSSHSHVYTYRNLCQQTQVINPADKMWNFKGGGRCWTVSGVYDCY